MASILDNTSAMNHAHHDCGGTVLSGPDTSDGRQYYCDTCGAYRYGEGSMPSGTDRDANQAAFDVGELCSPGGA